MTFRRKDIFSYRIARSGASYSPQFEAREAARFVLLTWPEFCAMDGEEQSAAVAHYRSSHYLEAVLQDDMTKRAKRNAKGPK